MPLLDLCKSRITRRRLLPLQWRYENRSINEVQELADDVDVT